MHFEWTGAKSKPQTPKTAERTARHCNRKTMMYHQTDAQRAMIAQCESESCLDRRIPLGIPFAARPEFGPAVPAYYRRKHDTSGPGQFYGLHIVGTMQRTHTNPNERTR
jgi:hypothetical protein